MNILFTERSWEHYLYWQKTDRATLKRINDLICDINRDPFEGIGKPEPLKREFQGYWSRRIDAEHRLVYKIAAEGILIVQCRYHY